MDVESLSSFYAEFFSPPDEKQKKIPVIQDLIKDKIKSLNDDDYDLIRIDGWRPSAFVKSDCLHFQSLTRIFGEKIVSSYTLDKIFSFGHQRHAWYQEMLSDYLTGTWVCKSCGAVHNQHSEYVSILSKKLKINTLSKSGKDLIKKILDNVVSHSLFPVKKPEKCEKCGSQHFSYKEWRIVDDEFEVIGKVDGVLEVPGYDRVILEIKSTNQSTFAAIEAGKSEKINEYKKQAGIYTALLNKVFPVQYALIIAEDRNFAKEFRIVYELTGKETEDLKKAKEYYYSFRTPDELVNHVPEKRNSYCKQCQFFGKECKVK